MACVGQLWKIFGRKCLTVPMLLTILIYRYLMLFTIHSLSIFFFSKFGDQENICFDGNRDG